MARAHKDLSTIELRTTLQEMNHMLREIYSRSWNITPTTTTPTTTTTTTALSYDLPTHVLEIEGEKGRKFFATRKQLYDFILNNNLVIDSSTVTGSRSSHIIAHRKYQKTFKNKKSTK